ncbi:MAG TPA: FMN-binding protein [Patescibacteria group bacterium]|nr:FMN-binding protein [Patescibacteria group bacterium]
MKKIALSALVIVVFIAYIIHEHGDTDEVHVVAPSSQQISPTEVISQNTTATPPAASSSAPPSPAAVSGKYKDGQYTSEVGDAFYGPLQFRLTVSGGRITDVTFLQTPNDRGTSIEINSQATPILKQETIAAQSATVDVVSGATQTSEAFQQLLKSTLNEAKT